MSTRTVYLASRSSRRRELLKQMGLEYQVLLFREGQGRPIDVDESPLPGELPETYVVRMAKLKAEIGTRRLQERAIPGFPLLAADTIVALDGHILGKPDSSVQAKEMLKMLSGRMHHVMSAIALSDGEQIATKLVTTEVHFRELELEEIDRYVATNEPLDKAGAYAIQGRAASFVSHLTGSYSGVVGLPIYETAQLLNEFGIKPI